MRCRDLRLTWPHWMSSAMSLMRPRRNLLLVAVAVLPLVVGCSRSELHSPKGVNYSPNEVPAIVLNQASDGWRVFVNGVERTGVTKLRVTTADGNAAMIDVETDAQHRISVLPPRFRLQWSLDGQIRCQAQPDCPAGMQLWTRTVTR